MSKLLEEAIADAKAVRATALANAKAALEEAFLPKAEAMLSRKLKEEAGMEEEELGSAHDGADRVGGSGKPIDRHAQAKSTEKDKGFQAGAPKFKEGMEDEGANADAKFAPGGKQGGDHLATRPFKEDSEDEGMEDEGKTISDAELDEILRELSEDMEDEGMEGADPNAPVPSAPVAPVDPNAPPVDPTAAAPVAPDAAPAAPCAPAPEEEEVDLNELLASLNEDSEEEEEEEDEAVTEGKKKDDDDEEEDEEDDEEEGVKESYKAKYNEAIEAVKYLRTQLHEVNLLNAKLLYTNKLFKNNALTNEQKMKIVETFDLTQTIREVKIAYTSLAESFNFGKSAVKKSNAAAKTITEGLASKTVASTKPAPSLIVENTSTQAKRFQTLAGIKKA